MFKSVYISKLNFDLLFIHQRLDIKTQTYGAHIAFLNNKLYYLDNLELFSYMENGRYESREFVFTEKPTSMHVFYRKRPIR